MGFLKRYPPLSEDSTRIKASISKGSPEGRGEGVQKDADAITTEYFVRRVLWLLSGYAEAKQKYRLVLFDEAGTMVNQSVLSRAKDTPTHTEPPQSRRTRGCPAREGRKGSDTRCSIFLIAENGRAHFLDYSFL